MLLCSIVLGKTQYEIENEYAFVDLPELLRIRDERRGLELLENIQIITFPHLSENKAREAILQRLHGRVDQSPPEPPKTAEEQYQALMARMKAGG